MKKIIQSKNNIFLRRNYAKKTSKLVEKKEVEGEEEANTAQGTNIENADLSSKYFPKQKQVNTNTSSRTAYTNATNTLACLPKKSNATKTESEREPMAKKLKWQPAEWVEQLRRIKEMRSSHDAPVDTMGCEALECEEPNQPANIKRYHILVSLMLSAQTKDEVTAKAMSQLYKLPLNIDTILSTQAEIIEKAIYPASFYKRKAQFIKRTSQILKDKYNYDIPNNVDELCKLPGVGPKMAYICMSAAWNNTVGIGVDTHVHRISNRLGWTRTNTKLPEQTRKELEEWLPQ